MAGDNLNVWYDPEGDHLEIVFDQKAGYFEDTPLENVMRKRDAEGNLLAISILNLSSFPRAESASGYGLWTVFNLDVDDGETFDFEVALGHERLGETEEETDPESTSVSMARADARATCSVFFHTDRPAPRDRRTAVAERTLEITAVQVCRDPAGGSCDVLGILDEIGQGRDQVPGFCCPD